MSLIFPVHPLFGRGGAAPLNVADLFSTDLYTGNGSTQTITNGIDLAGEGGLVWIKGRSFSAEHILIDTERGATNYLSSDRTSAEATNSGTLTSFNSSGFDIGSSSFVNTSPRTHAAWTFRRSPRFFDVVTYTGDGVAGRTVAHNLGVAPGMIVVKARDVPASPGQWAVYHRSLSSPAQNRYLFLNATNAEDHNSNFWNNTAPTTNEFTVGGGTFVNQNSIRYVAYLFAHDTASDGVIQCGSYTGNGSTTGPTINLGWEPQWVMIKRATGGSGDWYVWDSERGFSSPEQLLFPNDSRAEQSALAWLGSANGIDVTSTGFEIKYASPPINGNTDTHIYMAVRKEGV